MTKHSKKSSSLPIFRMLCGFYCVTMLMGFVLFSNSQWARQLRASSLWSQGLPGNFENWQEGDNHLQREDALVMVGKINGPDDLLVRNFSSLTFRRSSQDELLRGRNVLMTRQSTKARLWLVEQETWLEMEPNTLLVLDRVKDESSGEFTLNLNIMSGQWRLKDPTLTEMTRMKKAEARSPASVQSQASKLNSKIRIQDHVQRKEYIALRGDKLNSGKSLDMSQNTLQQQPLSATTAALWGEEIGVEGLSTKSPLKDLSRALSDSSALTIESEKAKIITQTPQRSLKPRARMGSLTEAFLGETRFIRTALGYRGRGPASQALESLPKLIEEAGDRLKYGRQFGAALALTLDQELKKSLERNHCRRASDIVENARSSYADNTILLNWSGKWIQNLKTASCEL